MDYLAIQTHIICEPVVLEGLHILSCHCMLVSHSEPFVASGGWSPTSHIVIYEHPKETCKYTASRQPRRLLS